MIVTPSIFEGELSIGQMEQPDVAASVQLFINKYEPLYLAKLLGVVLAKELKAGLLAPEPAQKWLDLSQEVKPMLANYVYYHFRIDNETDTAGVGEVEAKAENAYRVTAAYKIVRAWNEAARLARKFRSCIDRELYPEYDGTTTDFNKDIYKLINTFGI
jgi:hypothetical protein